MNKFLIIGLGNPGEEYKHSRHNIGFDVVDTFVEKFGGEFHTDRLAQVAEVQYKGKKFVCIKPTTYMNLSGKAVRYWLDKEKIAIDTSLTIVDDLALPLSRLRLRRGGSDAGHNGLKDIAAALGTQEYPRLRFGTGHNFARGSQVQFVLNNWKSDELPIVQAKIKKCLDVILDWAILGIEKAMNQTNNLEIKSLTE
jgi:PTH1 family peptidyl-tRNA hydrolase